MEYSESECKHDQRIKLLKIKVGYEWSCAECGAFLAHWPDDVWDALMENMPALSKGEGFVFNVVERSLNYVEKGQPPC